MNTRKYKIDGETVILEIRPVTVEITRYEAVLVREGKEDVLLNGEASHLNTYVDASIGAVHAMVTLEQTMKNENIAFERL